MSIEIQKAKWWKRILSFIVDAATISIIAVVVCLLMARILKYEENSNNLNKKYEYYEETYNVSFELTEEEYNQFTEEEINKYQEVQEIINNDEEFINIFKKMVILTIVIIAIGVFVGVMVVEFIIPLFLKNGQTIGKKMFDLCLVRPNSVKVSILQIFVRTFFGKYIIEIMLPIVLIILYIFGSLVSETIIGIISLLVIQICIYFSKNYRQFLHDRFSVVIVVDKQEQKIFDTYDELILYNQNKKSEDK